MSLTFLVHSTYTTTKICPSKTSHSVHRRTIKTKRNTNESLQRNQNTDKDIEALRSACQELGLNLVPKAEAHETAPIGTTASAHRYGNPDGLAPDEEPAE